MLRTDGTDGGPAFPMNYDSHSHPDGTEGMSLRDWFAGQALVNITAFGVRGGLCTNEGFIRPTVAAKLAYEYADAMLAERDK
jgi:hypothetical protein